MRTESLGLILGVVGIRPDKRDLDDAMLELVDVDIMEDNLDFTQVLLLAVAVVVVVVVVGEVVVAMFPQVCQVASRFQDEGDERQVGSSTFYG